MKKILACCSLIIASLLVTAAFVTATSYAQLAVAILFYPALVYFILQTFPRKRRGDLKNPSIAKIQPSVKTVEKVEPTKNENMIGITDIDKRVFLKLIGGAGLSLFLFSIFNKKTESLFFKSLPGQGATGRVFLEDIDGNKINPKQNQPLDGYSISEIDDNVISFYGSTNKDDAWYIMRIDTDKGSFRYAKGDSNFPSNWNNRKNLKYDYFNNVF